MNRLILPRVALIAATTAAFGSNSYAATIFGGGIVSNVSAPGSGSSSSSVGVRASSTLLKFVGDLNLTSTNGGTSLNNTLDINGSLTLDPQDAFILSYDYNVTLTGGGTVSLTTMGFTDFNGVKETFSNVETISTPGTYNFVFSELGTVATESLNGTWSGQLSFDWVDATAGSSLEISIPNDSIDFGVTSVPEPSSGILVLLGAAALLKRRRR